MSDKKFESMLMLIVPKIIQLILENHNCSDVKATEMLYNSKLYEKLEQEDTKLWHLSPLTLFEMFDEEQEHGTFVFPEEA